MINYGYFRHRFDSHNNPKLNNLMDEIGISAYAYYYTLIELYGAKYADKNDDGFVDIHIRVISNTWRKRVDSCDKVLTKLQLSGLLVYTKYENTCSISIPNFAKYYGSYKKRDPSTPPNKSKVNKRKVKIKKTSSSDELMATILDIWNRNAPDHNLPSVKLLNVTRKKKLQLALKDFNTEADWLKIFSVASKKGFIGNDGRQFIPNWDYVFRNNNWVKFYDEYEVLFSDKPVDTEALTKQVEQDLINSLMN
jgi:hypothetical protein